MVQNPIDTIKEEEAEAEKKLMHAKESANKKIALAKVEAQNEIEKALKDSQSACYDTENTEKVSPEDIAIAINHLKNINPNKKIQAEETIVNAVV